MESSYWVHDLSPFLWEWAPGAGLRWYGLAYLAAFAIAVGLLRWYFKEGRSPLTASDRQVLLTAIVVGTLLGGRLGYVVLYRPEILGDNPLRLFAVWEGGMASHGGMAGIAAALWWFSRWYARQPGRLLPLGAGAQRPLLGFWGLADIAVTLGPPGIFLGRLANFNNGELWGKVATVPWAVIFPEAQRFGHFNPDAATVWVESAVFTGLANPRHPSQLYAALLEGLVLGAFLWWRFWRSRQTRRYAVAEEVVTAGTPEGPEAPKGVAQPAGEDEARAWRVSVTHLGTPGRLTGEFMVAYGVLRVFSEVFREPDASLILGLSRGTFYSLVLLALGVATLSYHHRRPAAA